MSQTPDKDTYQHIEEAGANASEGINLIEEGKQAKNTSFFLPRRHLHRLLLDSAAQIKGGSYHLRRHRLKMSLLTPSDLIEKNPSLVYPPTWVLVSSRGSKVDKQEYPSHMYSRRSLSPELASLSDSQIHFRWHLQSTMTEIRLLASFLERSFDSRWSISLKCSLYDMAFGYEPSKVLPCLVYEDWGQPRFG